MHFRGAASLADVPYWRKQKYRLTINILPLTGLFLKPKSTTNTKLFPSFSI
jgi:hypothetical protein